MNLMKRNPDLEESIVKLYLEGNSAQKILDLLNHPFKTKKSVYDILRKHSVEMRKSDEAHRTIGRNSWFFSNINSREKAYILGLMITDGWICGDRESIGFSSVDRELTEVISNGISCGSSITVVPGKPYKILDHVVEKKESYQYQLSDAQLKDDLIRLGFQVDKTFNELLPYLKEELMFHLLRGIFDGDGCIYKLSGVEQPGIILYSGSQLLLKQIGIFLWTHLRIDVPEIKPANTISKISYAKFKDVSLIMENLYKNSESLRLGRKYEVWLKYENKVS